MGLRKGQKELVSLYRGGYCAVPAIPGGGKTYCLSLWAAEMIQKGLHKPGKILIVTYMNSAVNNFRQRISKELENRGINGNRDYLVLTIHSLCLQIVKDKPNLAGAGEDFEILDDQSRFGLVSTAVNEWMDRNEDRFKFYIDEQYLNTNRENISGSWHDRLCSLVSATAGSLKCNGFSPREAIRRRGELSDSSLLKACAEIYEIYDRKLKATGCMDFDDMLYFAKKLLEDDEELLQTYRNRYSFVSEDEAQDSNLIQNEILSMIANGNLLRVGDSNQAICGSFTSSDFKFFKEFCSLPGTKVYKITQSSRSSREIIDLANHFVNIVRKDHPVEACRDSLLPQFIEPVDPDDPFANPCPEQTGIRTGIFNSWEDEIKNVIAEICKVMKQYPDKTLAVLVPTSYKINDIVKRMDALNLPYELLDNTARERNRALRILGRTLEFLSSPEDSLKLADLVCEYMLESDSLDQIRNENLHGWEKEKEELRSFLRKSCTWQFLYPGTNPEAIGLVNQPVPERLKNSEPWRAFERSIPRLKQLLDYPALPIDRLILNTSRCMGFNKEETAIAQKIADDIRYIKLREPGFGIEDLSAELMKPRSKYCFFAGLIWDLKGYVPQPGCITISTYHKAKGMEWDVVFLTALDNSDFPVELSDRFMGEYWYLKEEYKNPQAVIKAEIQALKGGVETGDPALQSKLETICERARLLYVGITRAKEYLYLSGYSSNKGKKNEIKPSKYLLEIDKYLHKLKGRGGRVG